MKTSTLNNVDGTPRLLSPTSSSPRVTNRLPQILPSDPSARPSLPLGLPSGHLGLCICRISLAAHFPQGPKPFSSAYALASCFPEMSNKIITVALSYAAATSTGLMPQIRFSCEVLSITLFCRWWHLELSEAFNFFQVTMPALGPRAAHLQYELPMLLSSLKICLCLDLWSWRKKRSCSPVFSLHLDLGFLWSPTALHSISYFLPPSCSPASPPSLPSSPTNAFGPRCFTNTLLSHLPLLLRYQFAERKIVSSWPSSAASNTPGLSSHLLHEQSLAPFLNCVSWSPRCSLKDGTMSTSYPFVSQCLGQCPE